MITIKQINEGKIGEKFGGGEYAIKTYKKIWQASKVRHHIRWIQQVILMDTTGEIPADVNLGEKNIPLRGHCSAIKIVVAEIQEAEYLGKDRKKLYVDEWAVGDPTTTEPELSPYEQYQLTGGESEQVIRSKIKCWLVAAKVQTGAATPDVCDFADDRLLEKIIDSIMKG